MSEQLSGSGLLVHFGREAEATFHLVVNECDAPGAPPQWRPVHPVHAKGSLHYAHRAADAHGSNSEMEAFGLFLLHNHARQLAELIHNPGCSVKNGQEVPPSYWGAAWEQHRNHVHFAV
ncbi:MAG: hypothetical protein ACJ74U_07625 [Jatrophihabitantaceae bacterium]